RGSCFAPAVGRVFPPQEEASVQRSLREPASTPGSSLSHRQRDFQSFRTQKSGKRRQIPTCISERRTKGGVVRDRRHLDSASLHRSSAVNSARSAGSCTIRSLSRRNELSVSGSARRPSRA